MSIMLILDRDGCINKKAENSKYIYSVVEFEIYQDVIEFFNIFPPSDKIGYALVTNQQGIGKGIYTLEQTLNLHQKFLNEIRVNSADFPIYVCPHLENSCKCRKPNPKMILDAIRDSNMNWERVIFVGDSETDREAAINSNVEFFLIERKGRVDLNNRILNRLTDLNNYVGGLI